MGFVHYFLRTSARLPRKIPENSGKPIKRPGPPAWPEPPWDMECKEDLEKLRINPTRLSLIFHFQAATNRRLIGEPDRSFRT
jgi:hypothetical protein